MSRLPKLNSLKPRAIALGLALGLAGGVVAWWLRVPLAWMIGPMVATAAASAYGLSLAPVPAGRQIGQAVVGVAIGLRMTPAVLGGTISLAPAIVVATIGVIAVTTAAAFLLRPLARVDARTAFFATAAAGMADMAQVARRHGGDADAVATVHAIRVFVVVLMVPVLVVAFGTGGSIEEAPAEGVHPWAWVALMPGALVCAWALMPAGFPNPWLVGPMLGAAVFAAVEPFRAAVPWGALVVAQIAIGIALGVRFRRESLLRLPRVALGGLAVAVLLVVAAAAGGALLAAATGLPYAAAFLAVAPAGITEMVLTAKIMRLDATAVTAFQIVRIAVIAATILPVFGLYRIVERRISGSQV
ncbi:AbrB family transcriptional regulator [Elioraea rosea]|uniref:AbrB family transcriptional regulator n=1 Tax=Elioraea rosea TaxID=2492390 RepID=UPI001315A7A7|nr:AbrB family transcriptional regulator [Elioraea rosea]